MISVNLAALWSDETDMIIKGISEATENIKAYRKFSERILDMLLELGNDIGEVCRFWTDISCDMSAWEPIRIKIHKYSKLVS